MLQVTCSNGSTVGVAAMGWVGVGWWSVARCVVSALVGCCSDVQHWRHGGRWDGGQQLAVIPGPAVYTCSSCGPARVAGPRFHTRLQLMAAAHTVPLPRRRTLCAFAAPRLCVLLCNELVQQAGARTAGNRLRTAHLCRLCLFEACFPVPRAALQVGWGATSDFRENWVWDQAADTYVKDSEMAETLRKNNPQVRADEDSRAERTALLAYLHAARTKLCRRSILQVTRLLRKRLPRAPLRATPPYCL